MPKGKKSGGDYDGWIMRLIEKVEELGHASNLADWWAFAESKIAPAQGYALTESQKVALADRRIDFVIDIIPDKLGVTFERPFRDPGVIRHRDVTGAYGQKKGTWVSKAKINESIARQKEAKVWTKI